MDARPRCAVFSPDGSLAYVTAELGGTFSVVDTAKRTVLRKVDLHGLGKPVGIAVGGGTRAYVALSHGNGVAVIDTTAGRVVTSIRVGGRPWGVALTPDGQKLYTANGVSDDVSVVDIPTNRVIATVKAGKAPWGVAIAR